MRPVGVLELQVADRETQLVQLAEDARERCGDVLVDDELPRLRAPVEAPVPDREHTELRQRDGTALVPKRSGQLGAKRRRQRLDRGGGGGEREREQRRCGETP